MIPTPAQARLLWDIYALPHAKRNHCALVARLAVWFARQIRQVDPSIHIRLSLLEAAALLHDIDKNVPKKPGERHPDAAVRILRESGMEEVSDLVRTHPLHAILDQTIAPRSWEEKILYLSDKMVKHTIITVDERFILWRGEHLPKEAENELAACYPAVKVLEHEICSFISVDPSRVAALATDIETSTMK